MKLSSSDFAYVVKDKNLKKEGLLRGDVVFLMGSRLVPASSRDPYLQRELFVVAKVVDGLPQVPDVKDDKKAFLVDPRSLAHVEEELSNSLKNNISNHYG